MLFRWSASASGADAANQQVTIREAIVGSGADKYRPATSCKTDWQGTTASRYVGGIHLKAKRYQPSKVEFRDVNGASKNFAEICFTPRGRAFIRFSGGNNGAGFEPMNGVPRLELENTETSRRSIVVLPPNGVARVVTRL